MKQDLDPPAQPVCICGWNIKWNNQLDLSLSALSTLTFSLTHYCQRGSVTAVIRNDLSVSSFKWFDFVGIILKHYPSLSEYKILFLFLPKLDLMTMVQSVTAFA